MAKHSPVSESSAHLNLSDALPVVAESTTSRVLVTNDVMRVVQFTFDAGEMLTEHASPRAVAVQLVSGRMRFTVEGAEHAMADGDIIYLAPGATHSLVAVTACRMTLVMVDLSD
ncbi:cupin domain-containing protein [Phycicoccus sp. HDW14]|uniref:cupin domain-containing protein n=1 Tax=Phycicoccus sp. HDW14 TaxID=2714941 RepID=UPI00140962E1|nr:cupin domain-containing protein [Phycicoccus sp. HDW14]QIM22048.1 cupin domain-containing protein [Phycicoccus sp. HDW14]